MKTITLQLLRDHDACRDQRELFEATFGESANLTARNMARALKAGLDAFWLERLLPASAWAEYKKVREPALLKALRGES